MLPSKPSSQIQVPVRSSHVPWFEHKPSSGQSNSTNGKIYSWKVEGLM